MEWDKMAEVSVTTLDHIAESDFDFQYSAFDFLKDVGVVPSDLNYMAKTDVRLGYDPEKVPAWYLASAAFEWDQWGRSKPKDFTRAILMECRGNQRDDIIEMLQELGLDRLEAKRNGEEASL